MTESTNKLLHYGENTPLQLRLSLKSTIEGLVSRAKNKDFFEGLSIYLVEDFNDVKTKSDFKDFIYFKKEYETAGSTINPIYIGGEKEIAIVTNNTTPSWSNLFGLINNTYRSDSEIKEACLHELGHQFDYHFSTVKLNKKLIDITNKFLNKQISKKEFVKNTKAYFDSQLSDSKEFKQAWIKDVDNFKNFEDLDIRYMKLGYFIPDWFVNYDEDKSNDIDWLDGISNDEIESVSKERGEIFAQIFAYLLDEKNNTEEKQMLFSCYPNCLEIVKSYIDKHLGINL